MTRPRKTITLATKVAVLQSQALCPKCGQRLGDDIEWNHVLEHALEGSDGPENIEAVHRDCHAEITNGKPATTAGSSKANVAKVKRIVKKLAGNKVATIKLAGQFNRVIRNRGFQPAPVGYKHFPPGRKIQSRKALRP